MRANKRKFRVTSLFSGCGGLDIPFIDDKYIIDCAYDIDKAAIKCLKYNLKCEAKVFDVASPFFENELNRIGHSDIVLGGLPCQGFSKSGPKKENDPRNKLYLGMLNAVNQLKPHIFLAENVDGIIQNFKGSYVEQIIKDFNDIGYNVDYRILNAVNYGVPQYRRRTFFIGTLLNSNTKFEWPLPTHKGQTRNGEFKTQWDVEEINLFDSVTIGESIEDICDKKISDNIHLQIKENDLDVMKHINEGQKLCNVRFSPSSVYTWEIPNVYGEISTKEKQILITIGKNRRKKIYGNIPNGNPLSLEDINLLMNQEVTIHDLEDLLSKNYLKKITGKYDLKGAMFCSGIYKRPKWDGPSPTVLTVFGNPRYFFHPKENRPFTIRECARLQSFPDDFKFLDSGIEINDAYRLIGNAVPSLLAKAIENSIYHYLEKDVL